MSTFSLLNDNEDNGLVDATTLIENSEGTLALFTEEELDSMTISEMKSVADDLGIEYTSKVSKTALKQSIFENLEDKTEL